MNNFLENSFVTFSRILYRDASCRWKLHRKSSEYTVGFTLVLSPLVRCTHVNNAQCRSKLDVRILDVKNILSYLANLRYNIYWRSFLRKTERRNIKRGFSLFLDVSFLDIVRICMNEINVAVTLISIALTAKGFPSIKLLRNRRTYVHGYSKAYIKQSVLSR